MNKLVVPNYEINKHYELEDDIDLSNVIFPKDSRIKQITECHLKLSFTRFEEAFDILLTFKGKLTAVCSYTLEEFEFPFSFKERISAREDEEGDYRITNNNIDLVSICVALIDNHVPLNVTKPGASRPSGGEGYRVLTEDELNKERESRPDPRWAALDDIELD